jgi:hypothetical protein
VGRAARRAARGVRRRRRPRGDHLRRAVAARSRLARTAAISGTAIDACGENGEYHSFAFDGAPFRTPVAWVAGATHAEGDFLQLDLLDPAGLAAQAIADHAGLFADTVAARPKAWGALAAQGVLAYRTASGRAPDDAERRAIWSALWRRVEAARAR